MVALIDRSQLDPDRGRSACPGLFRLAPALDGGICRVKLPCGHLDAAQAHAIADASARFGNGIIDATNRANLQIRGVRPECAEALTEALVAARLGPLSKSGDDIRNVMVSPTAGLDAAASTDTLPLGRRLLATLQTRTDWHALSPKFSILIDGGERAAPVDHPHDIWLAAIPGADGVQSFAFGFAGCPPLPGDRARAAAAVAAVDAHDLVAATIELFLGRAAARPDATRMRHLLTDMPEDGFVAALARRVPFPIRRGGPIAAWRRRQPLRHAYIGIHMQRQDGLCHVGAVPPLGRLTVSMLRAVGRIAAACGDGMIRMTPWRSVLLPNVRATESSEALRRLGEAGLACHAHDPLATMIACSGSAGCGSAFAATQTDGRDLAALLRARGAARAVHLSGCSKSCAAAAPAPTTLVGVAPGRYDLFVRDAKGPSRFGRRIAGAIDIDQAADLLAGLGADPGE